MDADEAVTVNWCEPSPVKRMVRRDGSSHGGSHAVAPVAPADRAPQRRRLHLHAIGQGKREDARVRTAAFQDDQIRFGLKKSR